MTGRTAHPRSTHTRMVLALVAGVLVGLTLPGLASAAPADPGTVAVHGPAAGTSAPAPALASAHAPARIEVNQSTLVLFNNSHVPGYYVSTSSSLPSLEVFDPASSEVFVEGFYSGVIDVLNTRTNEVAATVSTGIYPNTLAYDPVHNEVFYGLQTDDLVGLINATTLGIERSVNIGFEPLSMAADPVTGNLFVTGWNSTGTAFLAILNGTTGVVNTTFSFGANRFPVAGPDGLAYDPANETFYIPSIVGGAVGTRGNLTEVNASTFRLVTNISLGFNPDGIVYAPSDGDLYLGNQSGANLTVFDPASGKTTGEVDLPNSPSLLTYGSTHKRIYVGIDGNVSVVSTVSNQVTTTFPVTRQPDGLAFDPRNGELYISDYVWNNVSVVNTTSFAVAGSILLGALPYNMAYDPANGNLYVADLESSQLIVVNGTTNRVVHYIPLGATPYGIVYDPVTKDLYVDNFYASNVSIVSPATNAIVGYLPSGTNPWGIAYDGASHNLYVTNVGSNNITILSTHKDGVVRSLNFTTPPGAIAYDPVSRTMFVGEYNVGNVSVLNATTNRLIRNATSGSEVYTISVDPITGDVFVGNYASDNVTVLGPEGQELGISAAAGVGVFGSAYDPVDGNVYVASFDSELVTVLNGTTGAGVGGYSVGTGPVAVAVNSRNGTVYIANYDSGSLTLLSRVYLYNVTFTENGLPHGRMWSVGFNGGLATTNASSLTFTVTNGSYGYLVTGPGGLTVSGLSPEGRITVNGADVARSVTFAKGKTYTLTFRETGLVAGTLWCVTLGTNLCSGGGTVVFHNLTNATYSYRIDRVTGYSASPGSGKTTIAGASVKVAIAFTAVAGPDTGTTVFSGPPVSAGPDIRPGPL